MTTKNKSVCKGCKYLMNTSMPVFKGTCAYAEMTGQSRLVAEMENGGYKTDGCICYEKGVKKNRISRLKLPKKG